MAVSFVRGYTPAVPEVVRRQDDTTGKVNQFRCQYHGCTTVQVALTQYRVVPPGANGGKDL